MRLQRALARAGVASRRAAEELIVAGRVRVNGAVATIGVPASRALAHAVALSCGSASMTQTRSPVASAATAV